VPLRVKRNFAAHCVHRWTPGGGAGGEVGHLMYPLKRLRPLPKFYHNPNYPTKKNFENDCIVVCVRHLIVLQTANLGNYVHVTSN